MTTSASSSQDDFPEPFLNFLRRLPRVRPEVAKAKDFYQLAAATRSLGRRERATAESTWVLAALMADANARRYLERVILTEGDWLTWFGRIGGAVHAAMEELTQPRGSVAPKRAFEQRRAALVKALRDVQRHLAALDVRLGLPELADRLVANEFRADMQRREDSRQFQEAQRMQQARARAVDAGASVYEVFAAPFLELAKSQNPLPDFGDLVMAAEQCLLKLEPPPVTRHGARAIFLREMFGAFSSTAVASRRTAFLSFASSAVFGEDIDRRDVRRLVSDLVEQEKAYLLAFGPLGGGDFPAR